MSIPLRWIALLCLFVTAGAASPLAAPPPSTSGAELLREVQDHLKRLGYYQGDINGSPNRETGRAIGQFRWNAGMSASEEPTPEVIQLLRERVKAATPQGLRVAEQGPLVAYVGPGRWCATNIRVTVPASGPATFQPGNEAFQALVTQLRDALANDCNRFRRAQITGTVNGAHVYLALLDDSGTLKVRTAVDSRVSQMALQRQTADATQRTSVCAVADPESFDEVFACMSSARWTHGLSAGRNRFEGNIGTSSCQAIAGTYAQVLHEMAGLPRDQARQRLPACDLLARAAREFTGKPAYWANCTGYGTRPVRDHMMQCLEGFVPGYYGERTPVTTKITGCATAISAYEHGLKAAHSQSHLPPGYSRPSCDLVLAMIGDWTGAPVAAASCRGYTPDNVAAHVMQCLGQGLPLASLRTCQEIRRLYEALLVEAHGGLPPDYITMPCSAAEPLLARAETERSEAAERKRAVAVAKQQRRTEAQQARQQAQKDKHQQQRAAVQSKLDLADAQFKQKVSIDPKLTHTGQAFSPEEAVTLAKQAALSLNASKGAASTDAGTVSLPQVDQRQFQPVPAGRTTPFTANPTEFFWSTMGNELAKANASLTQVANMRKELRRHTRNLHTALETCCSCQYRDTLLEEFVKWKSEQLFNEQVISNAAKATQERNVDFSRLVPDKVDANDVLALAPAPCHPPTDTPEPKVKDELTSNGSSLYSRTVDWGYVPDDFVLPTPPYTPNYKVLRYRAHIQVPGRLRTADVQRFSSDSLSGIGSSNDYQDMAGTEKLISQDIEFARQQGAYVLHCYYLRNDYLGSERKLYWYKERPEMTDRQYLQARVPNHLLLNVGEPLQACPPSL